MKMAELFLPQAWKKKLFTCRCHGNSVDIGYVQHLNWLVVQATLIRSISDWVAQSLAKF